MITLDATVEEVLNDNPALASLFVSHRMICVGCDIARFHTLQEAAVMYKLDPEIFLAEINQRIASGMTGTGNSDN